MRAILGLSCAALALAQPLIRKPAQPGKFVEAVGRRAAILGREDGTFEAWLFPIKVLRDFRLSVYFDGALEPVPLAEMAERVEVAPWRTTIVHSHAAFTVRQTWVAALDRPLAAVLLEIDTGRPLRLRASFVPEFKPMWPASFGGQSSAWDASRKVFVLGEGLRRFGAVIGSPQFARASEQVGHQLPDRTVLLEMDIAGPGTVPIVIAPSREAFREADAARLLADAEDYYRRRRARLMEVETPEPVLNHAFEWAQYALEKGWICNEGVGCGLVAGFAPSGAGERPGFAWYFGGDAFMNSWSLVDSGDFARARAALEFLRERQRADGKMMHELTQSAALLDWSRYPYGYYHGDTTPLYLFSAARYVERSGDMEFLRASWPSIEKAYAFCLTTLDEDGLMSNRKAGAAAVETGALAGKVAKDVYLQGAWLAGLRGYVALAKLLNQPAVDAEARLARARAALNAWFLDARGFFPFGKLADDSVYEALSSWQALALAHGGLDPAKAVRAAAALNRPELSTDWGARLFATDSPFYDPLSYNDGSVWPFVTGFVTLAEFLNHRGPAGLQHLYGTAALTGLAGAGFIPEYLSGDRAQALPRSVPHQLFSSSAVIHPLVSGLLGLGGDPDRLRFTPHLPPHWPRTRFARYRLGNSEIAGELLRAPGRLQVRVAISGKPLRLEIAPALPPGSRVTAATLNGRPVAVRLEDNGGDVHAFVSTDPLPAAELTLAVEEGREAIPELRAPEPGSRSRAVRLLDAGEVAGPAGATAQIRLWPKGEATVTFPATSGEFSRARLRF